MAAKEGRDLQVQSKKELAASEEKTVPTRSFVPQTDIFETKDALTLVMEMPGVEKGNVDVRIEDDVLDVEGRIDFSKYEDMAPIYSEYIVGHYGRRFTLPSRIDREKISAQMDDGVLTLRLPKETQALPRQIKIG